MNITDLKLLTKHSLAYVLSLPLMMLRLLVRQDLVLYGSGFDQLTWPMAARFNADNRKKFFISAELTPNYVRKYSMKYFWVLIRSKEWNITHNPSDIYKIKLNKLKIVNHWHGFPIKYIGLDSLVERQWINRYLKLGIPLPYSLTDEFYVYDDRMRDIIHRATKIDLCRIVIKPPVTTQLSAGHKYDILYLPTFRTRTAWENQVVIENLKQIQSKFKIEKIHLKLHPHSKFNRHNDLPEFVELLDNSNDTYMLIAESGIVITDYSSCAYDAEIVFGKKVFVCQSDRADFIREHGGLYPCPFKDLDDL
jgi:CDP-glycerol glycerophosphotransferase (TagB/SpsB family)